MKTIGCLLNQTGKWTTVLSFLFITGSLFIPAWIENSSSFTLPDNNDREDSTILFRQVKESYVLPGRILMSYA